MGIERSELYRQAYQADYEFERIMVHYRKKLLLERLDKFRPDVVVEIGCGSELLYDTWMRQRGAAKCWVIVEPVHQFAEIARTSNLPGLYVICNFFEDSIDTVRDFLTKEPDIVICSGLLHEVPSALKLLESIHQIMGWKTILHVNVPNAESMHRRLAKSMRLINNTKQMSKRNVSHLQNRVYDINTLKYDMSQSNLQVVEEGGYLIKPFTHEQMENIVPVIGRQVLDGLFLLGKEMPEQASEIFLEVRKRKHE